MEPRTDPPALATRITRVLAWCGASRAALTVYYLAILLLLVLLHGRGDVSTAGFIYQRF